MSGPFWAGENRLPTPTKASPEAVATDRLRADLERLEQQFADGLATIRRIRATLDTPPGDKPQ